MRRLLWAVVESALKLVLAVETGTVRGHIVTQNLVARAEVSEAALAQRTPSDA